MNQTSLISKYVISPIDGESYCRKNGQFLRHIRKSGYANYQEFFEDFYPHEIKYCICGNKCLFDNKTMGYLKTCGKKACASRASSQTKQSFTAADWDQQRTKFRSTMEKKSVEQIQHTINKRKQTNIDRYGVDHPWKSSEVREKIKHTMASKYGQCNFSSTLIPDKSKELLNTKEWLEDQHINKRKPLYQIGQELNVGDRTVGLYLKKHNIPVQRFQRSYWEIELEELLQRFNIDYVVNDRTILRDNKELDFYIPSKKLAIELCGLYWHSERQERITKWYHYDKLKNCEEKGITLLTIFDDEWNAKDIIVSKIRHLVGLNRHSVAYARKLTIDRAVPFNERSEFLKNTHIQGNGRGSISIGLRSGDQLVALGLFSKRNETSYVLERFSTSVTVVGGFSKILKDFERHYNPKKIITFADRRYSSGNLYEQCGFEEDNILPPDYAYVVNGIRVHKFNFRHKSLKRKLANYDPSKSERDNCFNHGLYRVWDCGKVRYVKTFC